MLAVIDLQLRRADLSTRMPFRYGIATLTHLPHVFAVVEISWQGQRQRGIAADHLPPKWFTKDPDRDPHGEIADMLTVMQHAAAVVRGGEFASAFACWQHLEAEQMAWGAAQGYPPLLYRFGTALVERAVLDACCRLAGKPFAELLHGNAFGIELGAIHASLQDLSPADLLPSAPLPRVHARHTVGLSDPLRESDIPQAEKLADGLPQSLEACIARYGLNEFKIKVTDGGASTHERLRAILRVVREKAGADFRFSLDGNESFAEVEAFRAFWEAAKSDPEIGEALDHCLFVEQPFHRDIALSSSVGEALLGWRSRPTMIIDESDAEPASLLTALDCGYHGISHKNCKGIFKGVANACFLAKRRVEGSPGLMSGEDLANIGPVAVLQDLAVQAALGNASVERNGHHYFNGLSMWPQRVQEAMTTAHGDVYASGASGVAQFVIRNGEIDLTSVNAAPLGVAPLEELTWLGEPITF